MTPQTTGDGRVSAAAEVLYQLRGGLVVSCQAPATDPFSGPDVMAKLADSVVRAGAIGIRGEGIDDLRAIRRRVSEPLIGLWKDPIGELIITPTLEHALAVAASGADIIALDGTIRRRPDGRSLAEVIDVIHKDTGCLVMADVSTLKEGILAEAAGADMAATTLSGYTNQSPGASAPDLDLVEELVAAISVPVFAEGRIGTPDDARRALERGAWAVVVGTAITSPAHIVSRFCAALEGIRPSERVGRS